MLFILYNKLHNANRLRPSFRVPAVAYDAVVSSKLLPNLSGVTHSSSICDFASEHTGYSVVDLLLAFDHGRSGGSEFVCVMHGFITVM